MARSIEQVAAARFMQAVSDITFMPHFFATAVANDHPVVQDRVMAVVMAIIHEMAGNAGSMQEENSDAIVWACRLNDTIEEWTLRLSE